MLIYDPCAGPCQLAKLCHKMSHDQKHGVQKLKKIDPLIHWTPRYIGPSSHPLLTRSLLLGLLDGKALERKTHWAVRAVAVLPVSDDLPRGCTVRICGKIRRKPVTNSPLPNTLQLQQIHPSH